MTDFSFFRTYKTKGYNNYINPVYNFRKPSNKEACEGRENVIHSCSTRYHQHAVWLTTSIFQRNQCDQHIAFMWLSCLYLFNSSCNMGCLYAFNDIVLATRHQKNGFMTTIDNQLRLNKMIFYTNILKFRHYIHLYKHKISINDTNKSG